MSKRANPVLIGTFVLGSLFLLVSSIVFLGSVKLFSKEEQFVMYFESSVNGLNVGAPLKFKGVPIGRVSDIRIRWNQDTLTSHIPVFVAIDPELLRGRLGVDVDLADEDVFRQQIRSGLRARMQIESLITGLLFIELDYYPDSPSRFFQSEYVLKEIPTVPGLLADITETATQIVSRLRNFDFEGLNRRLMRVLENADRSLAGFDTEALNQSFLETSAAVRNLAESGDIQHTLRELNALLAEVRVMAKNTDQRIQPLTTGAVDLLSELQASSIALRQTMKNLEANFLPESPLLLDLRRTLEETSNAAQALRQLADFIERNPNALLLGRSNRDFPE
jgi:paraquat-inducible protein B